MLVFISWSGAKSKAIAEALEHWLAQVIQAVEPWISQDIDKGLRWGNEIAGLLERSKVGIICLTKSNLDAKWIHFEAGALSKTKDAYVCTLLLDVNASDVEQPLAQFQHTTPEKEQIFKLLKTINGVVEKSGEKALPESRLTEVFEIYWPHLEQAFKESAAIPESIASPSRSSEEMLQEALEILRNQERRQALSPVSQDIVYYVTLNISGADEDKLESVDSELRDKNAEYYSGSSYSPDDNYSSLELAFYRPFKISKIKDILETKGIKINSHRTWNAVEITE